MTKEDVKKVSEDTIKKGAAFIKDNKYTVGATVLSVVATEAAMRNFKNKNMFSKILTLVSTSTVQVALINSAKKLDSKK